MGRFRLSDFKQIPLPPEKFYYIHLNKTFDTEAEAEKELNNINMMLRRLRAKQYADISFFLGVSTTDGDAAYKTVQRTGKIGRPHVLVNGMRVKPHLHIVVYGKLCASFCRAFSRKYNILKGKSIARAYRCQSTGYIHYAYEQSYRYRTCGDFDFSQYYDGMYLDVYPAPANYVNSDQDAHGQISSPLPENQRTADYIIHKDNKNRSRDRVFINLEYNLIPVLNIGSNQHTRPFKLDIPLYLLYHHFIEFRLQSHQNTTYNLCHRGPN